MITEAAPSTRTDHAEAPHTLIEPAPRALRLIDQLGLWGNLGVSLLGFTGAIFVLAPIAGGPDRLAARFAKEVPEFRELIIKTGIPPI